MTRTNKITRRKFMNSTGVLAGGAVAASRTGGIGILCAARRKKCDIRIEHISFATTNTSIEPRWPSPEH